MCSLVKLYSMTRGQKMQPKPCEDCGKTIIAVNNRHRFCVACGKRRRVKSCTEGGKRYREGTKETEWHHRRVIFGDYEDEVV